MKSYENLSNNRWSTTSRSSIKTNRNSLLNGLIPPENPTQTLSNFSSLTSNYRNYHFNFLNKSNFTLKRLQFVLFTLLLTFILALLFILTIIFSNFILKNENFNEILSNVTLMNNKTIFDEEKQDEHLSINSFFASVWFFNLLLFISCLFIHLTIYKTNSQQNRSRTAFIREFGRIFENGKCSTSNPLVDYLLKTCLLCLLWYLSSYLIFRSMSHLLSSQIIILYSGTITLRQVLGWIFLHEQFIGNKIIAHILTLSSLLFLIHDGGFRFNKFLLGLTMGTSSIGIKTVFHILLHHFIKDLKSSKLRIVMINICLCGTCLLWLFVLLLHLTKIETIEYKEYFSFKVLIVLICGLIFNILIISLPMKYTTVSTSASLLLVIPAIYLIDHYLLNIKYSPLVILSIICSFFAVLISMIPKQWLQTKPTKKLKQPLGPTTKDQIIHNNNNNNNLGSIPHGGTITGTLSTLDQIRSQRRSRHTLS